MPKSIQLISIGETSQLYLTCQGKQFLSSLDLPISIITIAGLYRTGKSFLVNQLLKRLESQETIEGFQVGNSVGSCTKGLNVYAKGIKLNKQQQFYYVLVDSQGIGSMEQEANYDFNLLILIFLISSTVIYNSVGSIDEQSLDQLRVIANIKDCLSKNKTQPRLIWVLRDFALQLINKKGQTISSNQYLQQCLEQVKSQNKQIKKKNQIRQSIKQNLSNRQCHTLVRPTINQSDLNNLTKQESSVQIRKQFTNQLNCLYQSTFSGQTRDIKTYLQNNTYINGPLFIELIQFYLNDINQKKVPQVQSIWKLMQSSRWDQLFEQCQNQIKRKTMRIDLPITQQQLKTALNTIQNQYFHFYSQKLVIDLTTYKRFNQQYLKMVQAINHKIKKANYQLTKRKILKQVRDIINRQVQFDHIDPCQIAQIKNVINMLGLKEKKQIQAYQYVLQTIFDVLDIAQQKSIKIHQQLEQISIQSKEKQLNCNSKQQQILRLKQSYTQSLKKMSQLSSSQNQSHHQYLSILHKCQIVQSQLHNITNQKCHLQLQLNQTIQQNSQKQRQKAQQNTQQIRKLYQENNTLLGEIQEQRIKIQQYQRQDRKEIVFQQRMGQAWGTFQNERNYLKNQLDKYRNMFILKDQQHRSLQDHCLKLQQQSAKNQQVYSKKEKQFCQQLKWMKQNYSKTKQAYNHSLTTQKQNQKILQDITHNPRRNKNYQKVNEPQQKHPNQDLLQQLSSQHQCQKTQLLQQISILTHKLKSQQISLNNYQKQMHILRIKNQQIQSSFMDEQQKFHQSLRNLDQAKIKERMMYEDSIMRLLNNIAVNKGPNYYTQQRQYTNQTYKQQFNPHKQQFNPHKQNFNPHKQQFNPQKQQFNPQKQKYSHHRNK